MAPKMESNKQERSNLLHDNPVARDASGGRPWISKHFKSSMSPLKDMHGSPAEKELSAKQEAAFGGGKNPGLEAAIEAAPEMKQGMHMNYDGVSKKYPAAGHQNEDMKEAFKKAGEAAGKAGAKVVNKVKKKNK
jgi:hypothetical protein